MYKGKKRHEMPPHIYAITDTAYRSMMQGESLSLPRVCLYLQPRQQLCRCSFMFKALVILWIGNHWCWWGGCASRSVSHCMRAKTGGCQRRCLYVDSVEALKKSAFPNYFPNFSFWSRAPVPVLWLPGRLFYLLFPFLHDFNLFLSSPQSGNMCELLRLLKKTDKVSPGFCALCRLSLPSSITVKLFRGSIHAQCPHSALLSHTPAPACHLLPSQTVW